MGGCHFAGIDLMQGNGGGKNAEMGMSYRLKIYIAITVILVVVALLSFLIVPRGSGAKFCTSFPLANSRYECLSNLAASTLNASVCGQLPVQGTYSSDSCYSEVARKTDDSATCRSIVNATSGYACTEAVAAATGNYSLCAGIGEPYASKCYQAIATRLGAPSLCNAIGNATSAEECSSVIYIGKMLRQNDSGYCANVTDVANESVANYVIANVTYGLGSALSNSSAAFESLAFMPGLTYTARDFCYNIAAEKLDNASLCADISAAYAAGYCRSQLGAVAVANVTASNYTQSIALCSKFGAVSQTCVQAVELAQAIATDNASECAQLGSLSDSCYSSIAAKYNDTGACGSISNASARATCLNGS